VFCRAADGELWHNWQIVPGGIVWAGWASLGGHIGTLSVAQNTLGP
jgi:hypothetical protein